MFNHLAKLRAEREEGDKGFTLIELLVVVVIIGILIAIAIPLYLNYRKGANDKSAMSDLRGAISTLEQCNSDNSQYPQTVTVNSANGACANQQVNVSNGTAITYWPSSTAPASNYIIEANNTNGSGTIGVVYCYSSLSGGSVKRATSQTVLGTYNVGVC